MTEIMWQSLYGTQHGPDHPSPVLLPFVPSYKTNQGKMSRKENIIPCFLTFESEFFVVPTLHFHFGALTSLTLRISGRTLCTAVPEIKEKAKAGQNLQGLAARPCPKAFHSVLRARRRKAARNIVTTMHIQHCTNVHVIESHTVWPPCPNPHPPLMRMLIPMNTATIPQSTVCLHSLSVCNISPLKISAVAGATPMFQAPRVQAVVENRKLFSHFGIASASTSPSFRTTVYRGPAPNLRTHPRPP